MPGEGSRGGKVIRHTKGGYAVYDKAAHVALGVALATGAAIAAHRLHVSGIAARAFAAAKPVIKANASELAIVGGTVAAMSSANSITNHRLNKIRPRLDQEFKENVVDTKKTIRSMSEFKEVTPITSLEDLKKSGLSRSEKTGIKRLGKQAFSGTNAFAYKGESNKKLYVIAAPKSAKQVLGHELGHIRDFQKGTLVEHDFGFMATLTGREVAREERAWKLSPFKGPNREPVHTDAINSYKITRSGARLMVGSEALLVGAALAMVRNLKR